MPIAKCPDESLSMFCPSPWKELNFECRQLPRPWTPPSLVLLKMTSHFINCTLLSRLSQPLELFRTSICTCANVVYLQIVRLPFRNVH